MNLNVDACRSPVVGDMIIACVTLDEPFVGVVRCIARDRYGAKNHVFITWQGDPPLSYNPEYGYCAFNIASLKSTYKIIRDGIEIK
tara:strand:+ start:432 stop:689 length:258 start_codon:yes stop_codon:yes gene_type:complete